MRLPNQPVYLSIQLMFRILVATDCRILHPNLPNTKAKFSAWFAPENNLNLLYIFSIYPIHQTFSNLFDLTICLWQDNF